MLTNINVTTISQLDGEMREAARNLQFERAAELRDRVKYLREREMGMS